MPTGPDGVIVEGQPRTMKLVAQSAVLKRKLKDAVVQVSILTRITVLGRLAL